MKPRKFKIPMQKLFEFISFCEGMEVKILCTYSVEDLFVESVIFIVRADIEEVGGLPKILKEEKLTEKFGKHEIK